MLERFILLAPQAEQEQLMIAGEEQRELQRRILAARAAEVEAEAADPGTIVRPSRSFATKVLDFFKSQRPTR